jgi:signal transduction histidine kinase
MCCLASTKGSGCVKEGWDLKSLMFNRIDVRLTVVFLFVGLVAPFIGIGYFYLVASSLLSQNTIMSAQEQLLLDGVAFFIILLIAVNTAILGFYLSRSFTRPLKEFLRATQELEKGNFSIRANIHTNDDLAQLSDAFNRSAIALGKMEEDRLQLDKAKSEFLSIVSHELRTPITPLKAQLQMLEQNYFGKLTERQRESLAVILRNTERLNKIIEDFLEISRIEAARLKFVFRKTNLEDLIHETVHFMEGFAKEKNITLMTPTMPLPSIDVDPDRISQVLRNLLHNAVKFSPRDSTIQIHATVQKDHVCFSVKDQGIGLTPEDQIRVFEPFYQVEGTLSRNYGGTGLGLTICRGIIEAQKGKIWVESKPGEGSTFYFTVPLVPVDEVEPIKVLFSAKAEIERKLKEEFMSTLGPMGMVEYNELKNKHALGKQDLMEYITSLEDQCILRSASALEFKSKVGKIFGEEIQQGKMDEIKKIGR